MFTLFIILFSFNSAYATSGACSYHNGVNCSAGASYTGNVQCNDGWINSSVLFSDTDECKSVDYCPQIVSGLACTTEADYARVQQEVTAERESLRFSIGRAGAIGSGIDNSATLDQDKLDSCLEDINLYNSEVISRNQCLQKQNNALNQKDVQDNTSNQTRFDALCVKLNGVGSVWDISLPSDASNPPCTKVLKETTSNVPASESTPTPSFTKFITASDYLSNQKKPAMVSSSQVAKKAVETETSSKDLLISGNDSTSKNLNLTLPSPEPINNITWYQKLFNWLFK